jgi:enediyne biosynthesis protein E4
MNTSRRALFVGISLVLLLGAVILFPSSDRRGSPPPDQEPGLLFADVTTAVGIDFHHIHGGSGQRYLPETMGAGGCVLDFDRDGWMDLYLVQSGPLPGYHGPSDGTNRLFRNKGDGTFEDVTARSGSGAAGYGQGAIAADYDGDGDTDLYVTNFGPNVLLRNNGDGTFTDVTVRAGVGDPSWSTSAAFLDADADGDLDLYVINYLDFSIATHRDCRRSHPAVSFYCHPDAYPMSPDMFYRNNGDGTFTNATAAAGLTDTTGKGLGVVVLDFDNDTRPDIYVANDSTPNFLYQNRGGGRFEEVGLVRGVAYNEEGKTEAGMGVDAGDVNGDGWLDLFVTNLSMEANALYLGGKDSFTYATRTAGLYGPSLPVLGFGTDMLDVDHDGDLDLVVVNGDVLDNVELFNDGLSWRQKGQVFLNDGTARFTEMDGRRFPAFATPRVGRGSMTLDFDNDGHLDFLVSYNNDHARLFRHHGTSGHWIGFQLIGTGKNTGAIGARVTIESAYRSQVAEVKAGSSYLSSGDPRLHFGLGPASQADRVTIRWPNGDTQIVEHLPAGHYHVIVQAPLP